MAALAHLNLTVTELDRSADVYARWFGFDQRPETMPDGTALRAAEVPISETHDEPGHASVKCLDPDGYEIEISWDQ